MKYLFSLFVVVAVSFTNLYATEPNYAAQAVLALAVASTKPCDASSPACGNKGCECGCVQTGHCVCANCDHPVKGTKTGSGCACGCVETGKCSCKDCNHPMAAPMAKPVTDLTAYFVARKAAIAQGKPLAVFLRQPAKEMPGHVVCRSDSLFPELGVAVVVCEVVNGDLGDGHVLGAKPTVSGPAPVQPFSQSQFSQPRFFAPPCASGRCGSGG